MAYQITKACLKCGCCIARCPAGAIIAEPKILWGGLTLQPVHIDQNICTGCGTCVSEELLVSGAGHCRRLSGGSV